MYYLGMRGMEEFFMTKKKLFDDCKKEREEARYFENIFL
jgi:hypothetical protein